MPRRFLKKVRLKFTVPNEQLERRPQGKKPRTTQKRMLWAVRLQAFVRSGWGQDSDPPLPALLREGLHHRHCYQKTIAPERQYRRGRCASSGGDAIGYA